MPYADPEKRKCTNRAYSLAYYHNKKSEKPADQCSTCSRKRDSPAFRKCSYCRTRMVNYKRNKKDPLHPFDPKPRGHFHVEKDPDLCKKPTCENRRADTSKKLCESCRATWAQYSKNQRARVKEQVFDHYGWSCQCCGEGHRSFLSIDHVRGGGSKHLGSNGRRLLGHFLYKWLVDHNFPAGFQTLCHNCNFSKGHSPDGECEHQRKKG